MEALARVAQVILEIVLLLLGVAALAYVVAVVELVVEVLGALRR